MGGFVAQYREEKYLETYPSEPYQCANCERPREEYEKGWQLRHKSREVDEADDYGQHVIVVYHEHFYLCPMCSRLDPQRPAWRRFLRALAPDGGPPKCYHSHRGVEHPGSGWAEYS